MRPVSPARAAALLAAALATPLAAQAPTPSPHGELKVACSACHLATGWTPVRVTRAFDHAGTGFALAGAHATASCRSCHRALDFRGAPTACAACHQDVHLGELGPECSRCHTPRSFLDRSAMARSHQATRFPLEGGHLVADCERCHVPAAQGRLRFVNLPADCVSCHLSSYQAARNPDHAAGAFPRDCAQCHSATVWNRARFNHAATRFALTGAHRAVACSQCHLDNRFSGIPATCVGCHRDAFDRTTAPSHAAAQFPTDCVTCHSTVAWTPSSFDHARSGFALTGAHRSTPCQQCHANAVYRGAPTTCLGCHQPEYDRSTNPNHLAARFPTDCSTCHTTVTWIGARFDHDGPYFPIYSGKHRGKWTSCATCHTVASDLKQFTCAGCHEHDQSRMDPKHREVTGYRFEPRECLRCHPDGRS